MSKALTIAGLVRVAAKSEPEFVDTVRLLCTEDSPERIADFFDRLNIPRGVESTELLIELPSLGEAATHVGTFAEEQAISNGIQKYFERHVKKIKWHTQHPSIEGARNAMLVMRQIMMVTELRLARLRHLLASKDELTPSEWAIARELMNKAFLGFRHFLVQFGEQWIDAAAKDIDRSELEELVGSFYEMIDFTVRRLEEQREAIEARRHQLTVVPEGFAPVKPPRYFGGDLLNAGPWKQYWTGVENAAHHFREALA